MSTAFENIKEELGQTPRRWLVTGAAGFIGSNLVETLLTLGQDVVGLDNFATGHPHNLEDIKETLSQDEWARFRFVEGDICKFEDCAAVLSNVDYVLHQAALGSVPRSMKDPLATNQVNVNGFLNMLAAARDAGVRRFVYASSSSVYGDDPTLPKKEDVFGSPLSPYAASKRINELYAQVFARAYNMEIVGLRYFNVFGKRQDPNGAYAAVIPRWVNLLLQGERGIIFGDGKTSRDFCYIDNAVQANILGAVVEKKEALAQVYNVAVGSKTSLNDLYKLISRGISEITGQELLLEPEYAEPRPGDIQHSLANISKAQELLGYQPLIRVEQGLERTLKWFIKQRKTI